MHASVLEQAPFFALGEGSVASSHDVGHQVDVAATDFPLLELPACEDAW